jgi:NarL family two-component system response regulator LiaR
VLQPLLPKTRFLVLTSSMDPAEARRAMAAGAVGFLLKNASSQELVTVIRTAMRGQHVLAPEITDAMMATGRGKTTCSDLTQREPELLALMSRGLSNQDIVAPSIAMPTVKFHVTNILAKLHADNRTEAVLVALKSKLVTLD